MSFYISLTFYVFQISFKIVSSNKIWYKVSYNCTYSFNIFSSFSFHVIELAWGPYRWNSFWNCNQNWMPAFMKDESSIVIKLRVTSKGKCFSNNNNATTQNNSWYTSDDFVEKSTIWWKMRNEIDVHRYPYKGSKVNAQIWGAWLVALFWILQFPFTRDVDQL